MLSAVCRSLELSTAALSIVAAATGWSDQRRDAFTTNQQRIVAPPPTDADFLGTLHQMNVNEINAAKLAQTMSGNSNVRALASQIISDHTTLDQQASALASQLGLTPTIGDSMIVREGSAELDNLRARNGSPAFDLAFSGAQVQDHMEALALVDAARRVAQSPEFKSALVSQIRPVIVRHLQMAKSIRAGIGRPDSVPCGRARCKPGAL